MAVGDFEWTHLGSAAEQEKLMSRVCLLGPWTLLIVEKAWYGMGVDQKVIWMACVNKWDQQTWEWNRHYTSKVDFTDEKVAKEHLEDWYANNVLFEHLMLGKENGASSED